MNQTLTKRIETILDRWNAMSSRAQRAAFASRVTSVSIGLDALGAVHRELLAEVVRLEDDLDALDATNSTAPTP